MNKYTFYTLTFFLFVYGTLNGQNEFDGYALFNDQNSTTTYLIDAEGEIANTWQNARPCNYAVLLKENGNLMRGATRQGNQINGPAVGGMVQEIDPNNNVIWEFEYSSADYVSHHDITLMPNGGVLLIAWEVKSAAEMQAAGYVENERKYPTHFIEVQQDGTGGKIVWEWHLFDHLIQDVDPALPNYGVISEHPERLDINVRTSGGGGGPGGSSGDWVHVNGIDYDPIKDQIAFSSRYLSEVFIIDHSTTTEEAKGSTGGNAGKGGDFLYRWGKPSNYGLNGQQLISGPVHDTRFIEAGPRKGFLQFFNNDGPNNNGSTVDALELPYADDAYNYIYTEGEGYGPSEATFTHKTLANADGQSASNSLPNGNVFVNLSRGYMYEVNPAGERIWSYPEGPPKAFRYTCDHPGIQQLINLGTIDGTQCGTVSNAEILAQSLSISPNPSTGYFHLIGQTKEINSIEVFDLAGKKIKEINQNFTQLNLNELKAGTYYLSIKNNKGVKASKKIIKL